MYDIHVLVSQGTTTTKKKRVQEFIKITASQNFFTASREYMYI